MDKQIKSFISNLENLKKEISFILPQIKFEMAIAGGAVRDYYCNQKDKIKDLDVLIYFPKQENEENQILKHSIIENFLISQWGEDFFNQQALWEIKKQTSGIKYDPISFWKIALQRYISEKLSQKYKITNLSNQLNHEYFGGRFVGLIQLEKIIDKPIDLIIVDKPIKHFIEENFNFNINKISFNGNSFYTSPDFLNDYHKKTITLNPKNFTEEQVLYSLDIHYPRFKNKYPEYQLGCITYKHCNHFSTKTLQRMNLLELNRHIPIAKKNRELKL